MQSKKKKKNTSEMSGSWSGWYEQCGRHAMNVNLQIDCSGNISGSGSDDIGAFTVNGSVNQCNKVHFTKQYCGGHAVIYDGNRHCNVISGNWTIPNPCGQPQTSSFELTKIC